MKENSRANREKNTVIIPHDFSDAESLNGDYRMTDGSTIVITDDTCTVKPKYSRQYSCKRDEAILQLLAWMQVGHKVDGYSYPAKKGDYQIV